MHQQINAFKGARFEKTIFEERVSFFVFSTTLGRFGVPFWTSNFEGSIRLVVLDGLCAITKMRKVVYFLVAVLLKLESSNIAPEMTSIDNTEVQSTGRFCMLKRIARNF